MTEKQEGKKEGREEGKKEGRKEGRKQKQGLLESKAMILQPPDPESPSVAASAPWQWPARPGSLRPEDAPERAATVPEGN